MTLENHGYLLGLLAGLAFFMFGLDYVSNSLRNLMGNRVRDLLAKLTTSKFLSINVGVLLTTFMQSSGAVTSLLVALGNARVTTLPQVMGVIIGSAIGSTITVQLISFNIAQYGLPIFTLAYIAYFLAKTPGQKSLSGIFLGFGMVFFGLELMSVGASRAKDFELLVQLFAYLNENHIMALVLSAVVTAFVHSSAVTVGLAMTLAASNVISIYDSIYWVFGANLGTTSTALMAAVGGNAIGRRVAWANVMFKVGTLAVVYLVTDYFFQAVELFGGDAARQVANAHTLFNLIGALAFYPFIEQGAAFLQKQIQPSRKEKEFGLKYIDKESIMSPIIAFSEAQREVGRMGDIVNSMLRDSVKAFEAEDEDLVKSINDRDNKVDLLQREIKEFLISVGGQEYLANRVIHMISFVSDLENAADVIDRGLMELARKKHALKLSFSDAGWEEICELHKEVMEQVKLVLSCFQLQDLHLANKVVEKKRDISKLENKMRNSHFERLNRGVQESIKTSSIHLDAIADYRRISSVLCHHAYDVIHQNKKIEDL